MVGLLLRVLGACPGMVALGFYGVVAGSRFGLLVRE